MPDIVSRVALALCKMIMIVMMVVTMMMMVMMIVVVEFMDFMVIMVVMIVIMVVIMFMFITSPDRNCNALVFLLPLNISSSPFDHLFHPWSPPLMVV